MERLRQLLPSVIVLCLCLAVYADVAGCQGFLGRAVDGVVQTAAKPLTDRMRQSVEKTEQKVQAPRTATAPAAPAVPVAPAAPAAPAK